MLLLRAVAYSVGTIIVSIPASLFLASVASTLWRWFVVPLGVPAAGVFQLWGLSLLLTYFLIGIIDASVDDDLEEIFANAILKVYGAAVLWAPLALLVGWVLQGLM